MIQVHNIFAQIIHRMGAARRSTMDVTCLKPSEYRGDQNTAVAGRIVILKQQEVKPRKAAQVAATPAGGNKGKVYIPRPADNGG